MTVYCYKTSSPQGWPRLAQVGNPSRRMSSGHRVQCITRWHWHRDTKHTAVRRSEQLGQRAKTDRNKRVRVLMNSLVVCLLCCRRACRYGKPYRYNTGISWISSSYCQKRQASGGIGVSPRFEWQTAISQLARADETHNSFSQPFLSNSLETSFYQDQTIPPWKLHWTKRVVSFHCFRHFPPLLTEAIE